jgi:G:T/U-mismatch repair DNA glycosylase
MPCPIEEHQFLNTWRLQAQRSPDLEPYLSSWIINPDQGHFGFIPSKPRALFVGTFPVLENGTSGFFYHSRYNKLWSILSRISGQTLNTIPEKLQWLSMHGIAITDIVQKAQRAEGRCNSTSDSDLIPFCYNNIWALMQQHPTIQTIYLTSGGPSTRSTGGKSAGGWLCTHLREVEGGNLKKELPGGAKLDLTLKRRRQTVRLVYLITPADMDGQLNKHLGNNPNSANRFRRVSDENNVEFNYKCVQWAHYLQELPGVVSTDFLNQINHLDLATNLMEYNVKNK